MQPEAALVLTATAESRMKTLLILGALNSALAVMLGAFGAHGLKARVDESLLATWATATPRDAMPCTIWRETLPQRIRPSVRTLDLQID